MTHPRSELHVSARAVDLPDAIEVDVGAITDLHGAIHVSDLPSSGMYTILDPPEEVLAIVLPPKREVEEVEAAAEEVAEVAAEGAAAPTEAGAESQTEQETA